MIDTDSLAQLPTPALLLDGTVVRQNIQRLADYAAAHRLKVRPHTKTHKSLRVARLQLKAGAAGLTVAKLGEAEVMADACGDLLLAYPALDPWRASRLAALATRLTLHVAVDSPEAVDALAAAAKNAGGTIGILVDLDVGMGAPASKVLGRPWTWLKGSIALRGCGWTASCVTRDTFGAPSASKPNRWQGLPPGSKRRSICGRGTACLRRLFPAARRPPPFNRTSCRNSPKSGRARTFFTT